MSGSNFADSSSLRIGDKDGEWNIACVIVDADAADAAAVAAVSVCATTAAVAAAASSAAEGHSTSGAMADAGAVGDELLGVFSAGVAVAGELEGGDG